MTTGGGAAGEKGGDFYSVLGLGRECSDAELRIAYKKLAMRWHPDRCSANRSSELAEEAKEKFQEIQEAYSVLSDTNRRFLYDVGVYNSDDDDDENGMGDFLGEMVHMMSQTKSCESREESFEELQQLFVEMFHSDLDAGYKSSGYDRSLSPSGGSHKRDSSAMDSDSVEGGMFCFGASESGQSTKGRRGGCNGKRRNERKQKAPPPPPPKRDVGGAAGISAA